MMKEKEQPDQTLYPTSKGVQTLLVNPKKAIIKLSIPMIGAFVLTLPFFIFAPDIFTRLGAGPIATMAEEYARIIFGGTLIIFFGQVASAILRGEGDVNRLRATFSSSGVEEAV